MRAWKARRRNHTIADAQHVRAVFVRGIDLAALPDEISGASRDARLAALPRVDSA